MSEQLDYNAFRSQYEMQHPASVPKLEIESSPYPKWLKGATLIMFLAAALLSAVHTVPVMFDSIPESTIISPEIRTIAANGSVIAFELGLLLSAFLMVSKSSLKLAWVLLGTMFIGTLVANIYSISQTREPNIGTIAVTFIFGTGIPIIALSAGKLYVNIYTMEASLKKKANDTYHESLKQWDSTILAAYTRYQKDIEKRQTADIDKQGLSVYYRQTADRQQTEPYNRVGDATDKAIQYLRDNPDAINLPLRDIALSIGVGKDSVAKAKKHVESESHLSNGHVKPDLQ